MPTGLAEPTVDPRLCQVVSALAPAPPGLLDLRRLQKRFDRKYLISIEDVTGLLTALRASHGVLMAGERRLARYRTTYFDTEQRRAFHDHRRGRPRRAKVRTRTYVDRDLAVLEVKHRTGRGTTEKARQVRDLQAGALSPDELQWLVDQVDWARDITPVASNEFLRLTVLGLDQVERITVDLQVQFALGDRQVGLHNTAVVEIKTPTRGQPSTAVDWLYQRGLRPTGFSKYCAGSVLLDEGLPDHAFRPALRAVQRLEAA